MATVWDGGDESSILRRRQHRRRRNFFTFAYDTSVNLLANLLAAAIIYLFARATGLFSGNEALTRTAIGLISISALPPAIFGLRALSDWAMGRSRIMRILFNFVAAGILAGILLAGEFLLPVWLFRTGVFLACTIIVSIVRLQAGVSFRRAVGLGLFMSTVIIVLILVIEALSV